MNSACSAFASLHRRQTRRPSARPCSGRQSSPAHPHPGAGQSARAVLTWTVQSTPYCPGRVLKQWDQCEPELLLRVFGEAGVPQSLRDVPERTGPGDSRGIPSSSRPFWHHPLPSRSRTTAPDHQACWAPIRESCPWPGAVAPSPSVLLTAGWARRGRGTPRPRGAAPGRPLGTRCGGKSAPRPRTREPRYSAAPGAAAENHRRIRGWGGSDGGTIPLIRM